MDELISVIIPVYNIERYIGKCIKSVINQTYKNLEIILVDDGSTDKSGRICDEYAQIDTRILVIHKENEGLSDARNSGLEICKGKYIGFIDGDDWIKGDMYEFLYQTLTKYQADIAVCGHFVEDDEGVYDSECADGSVKIYNRRDAVCAVVEDKEIHSYAWDKLYERELFDGIQYPTGRYVQDIFTTYKLFEKADRVVCNNQPKYYYYQRKNSIQRTRGNKLNWDQFCAYKEMKEYLQSEYPELNELITIRLAGYGYAVHNCLLLQDSLDEEKMKQKIVVEKVIRYCKKEMEKNRWGDWKLYIRLFFAGRRWYPVIYSRIKKLTIRE